MKKLLLVALGTVTLSIPLSTAYARQTPQMAQVADSAFDRCAAQLVDLLTGRIAFADYFDLGFQTAVPEAQFQAITASLVAQYLSLIHISRCRRPI